jgi:hypothetical protein
MVPTMWCFVTNLWCVASFAFYHYDPLDRTGADQENDMDILVGDESLVDLNFFEDCLVDLEPSAESHNETAAHMMLVMQDDVFMNAEQDGNHVLFPANSSSTISSCEPLYAPDGGGEPHRKRVVRFLEDQDNSEPSLDVDMGNMGGGLIMAASAGGLAAEEMLVVPPEGNASLQLEASQQDLDSSIGMLDIFEEGAYSASSSQDHDASGNSMMEKGNGDSGDDDSQNSIDEEEEQEKQIRKTLMLTVFGMGLMGLVGFGSKKLMNMLSRGGGGDNDQDLGAGDIVGDGIDTATHAADVVDIGGHIAGEVAGTSSSSQAAAQASFNASANASQNSNGFFVAGAGNNPATMTGAQ